MNGKGSYEFEGSTRAAMNGAASCVAQRCRQRAAGRPGDDQLELHPEVHQEAQAQEAKAQGPKKQRPKKHKPKEPRLCVVPKLNGKSLAAAKHALKKAQRAVGKATNYFPRINTGLTLTGEGWRRR